MKKVWVTALAATGLLAAQTPFATVAPHPALTALAGAAEPLLGFALDAESAGLHPILGVASRPRFGSLLSSPDRGATTLYLPPLQRYALLENNGAQTLAVWTLKNAAAASEPMLTVIAAALVHPSLVSFSPTGGTAALFSSDRSRVQVIGGLPAKPVIVRELSTAGRTLSALAVTDDAELLVAQFDRDSMPFYSISGGSWQPVSTDARPAAFLFVPHSHDLLVSDPAQKEISLLPKVSETPVALRVLASDVTAETLAVTSDGDEVIAASPAAGSAWEIPLLPEGRFQRVHLPHLQGLSTLRDGHAFLFSSFPDMTLLRASASGLHAGR